MGWDLGDGVKSSTPTCLLIATSAFTYVLVFSELSWGLLFWWDGYFLVFMFPLHSWEQVCSLGLLSWQELGLYGPLI